MSKVEKKDIMWEHSKVDLSCQVKQSSLSHNGGSVETLMLGSNKEKNSQNIQMMGIVRTNKARQVCDIAPYLNAIKPLESRTL